MTPSRASVAALRGQGFLLSMVGEGRRWTAFLAISIGLHALFLLSGPRATHPSGLAPAGSSAVEVRLAAMPDSKSQERDERVDSDWRRLEPLPLQHVRSPRMIDFMPVDLSSAVINENEYLPVSRVTLRPIPVTRVAVPYPAAAGEAASTEAKIVLFIDENGSIAKVDLAKDQAPTPFAIAAKTTFERVRYRPALLDGKPVKVRVAIAVTFEDRQAMPKAK